MVSARHLGALLLIAACGVPADEKQTARPPQQFASSWPADQTEGQLPDSQPSFFPACEGRPLVTGDSLGPIRVGASLSELTRRCPSVFRYWDWGDEGIPEPAVALRVGSALVRAIVDDTLPASRVSRVASKHEDARTAQGIGPGKTLAEAERAYGTLILEVGECAIHAHSKRLAGVSWILNFPEGWDCERLNELELGKARPPADTRIGIVVVYGTKPQPPAASERAAQPPGFLGEAYVERHACAGEGCTVVDSSYVAKDTVFLRDEPDTASAVVATAAPGERLRLLETQVRSRIAPLVVRRAHDAFAPGDTVWLLNYLGEGHFLVRFRGQTNDMDLGMSPWGELEYPVCAQPDCWAQLRVPFPVATWWRMQKGDVAGWARVPANIEIAPPS